MTNTATYKLLDVLTGSELSLVVRTLRLREIDLQRQCDSNLKYATELEAEPQRRKFYQDMADDMAHEIESLTALLSKLADQ
jgi:hypothetical protein